MNQGNNASAPLSLVPAMQLLKELLCRLTSPGSQAAIERYYEHLLASGVIAPSSPAQPLVDGGAPSAPAPEQVLSASTEVRQADPVLKVLPVGKSGEREGWGEWAITVDVSDYFGRLANADTNEAVAYLQKHQDLLKRLRAQMTNDFSAIARKDGRYGLLFVLEHGSEDTTGAWSPPRDEVEKRLLTGMARLAPRFPEVDFCVPHSNHVYCGRPAQWAFVPDGELTTFRLRELSKALLHCG